MPPSKDTTYQRSNSSSSATTNYAKVYHQATNLMPYTPPHTPTGMNSGYTSKPNSSNGWGRQNSCNGKYS
ncbi:uncharacterized protein ACR2FA_006433 [Aphomia sociella]